jgi:hypothetical protein
MIVERYFDGRQPTQDELKTMLRIIEAKLNEDVSKKLHCTLKIDSGLSGNRQFGRIIVFIAVPFGMGVHSGLKSPFTLLSFL